MPLAKWYDPNLPQIIRMLDMCSDRCVVAAAFRTAFFWQGQVSSAHPVTKPRLISIQAFTLTTGSPIRVVYNITHCVTPIFLLYEILKNNFASNVPRSGTFSGLHKTLKRRYL
jgi:hypothetical protein